MHLETELAQFCLKNDKQKIEAQRGGLTLPINRGRYESAASVKFRLVKFFPKCLIPGQKVTKTLWLPGKFS